MKASSSVNSNPFRVSRRILNSRNHLVAQKKYLVCQNEEFNGKRYLKTSFEKRLMESIGKGVSDYECSTR